MSGLLRRAIVGVVGAMTLSGALAVGGGGATPPGPVALTAALTAAEAGAATVSLGSAMPSVVSGTTAVTITGTLTAPTTAPLPAGQVRIVRDNTVLTARSQIDTWAASTDPGRGEAIGGVSTPAVAAGRSAPFEITLAPGVVRSNRPFEAIPISLELSAASGSPEAVTHSFLAWNARKEYEPLTVAMLVPVTLSPDLDLFSRDQPAKDRAWQRAIGDGSRIQAIVEGTKDTPVTLVVDPAVLGLEAPAGPTGLTPPATVAPSTPAAPTPSAPGAPTAATPEPEPGSTGQAEPGSDSTTRALADALATELRGHSVWALPYADADVAAAAELEPTNPLIRDLIARAALLAKRLDQPVRSDVAWPVDERLPAERETGLTQMYAADGTRGPAAIVVRQDAITAPSHYTPDARRVASGGTPLLGVDPGLSAELPATAGAAGLSIQRYLADTLVLLGERSGTPRSILVAASRTWNPDRSALSRFLAATDVPWVNRVDAATLLGSGPPTPLPEQTPASPPPQTVPATVLTTVRLAQLASQRETILRVATVLRDGAGFEQTYRELLDELASVRWRYDPPAWTTLSRAVRTEVQAATSAIKVIPRDVNFLAESGNLQITVANGLDYEITDIRLVLTPTNPRMQIVQQPGPITIGADSRTTVRVLVRAVAAGQADIRAALTTADGTPIGEAATIPVSANPLDAQIYLVGGIVLGLILIAGVLRTMLRGTSRMEEIGGDPEDLPAAQGPPADPLGGGPDHGT